MSAYQKGQTIKLTFSFTNAAGAPANPTTVTAKVEKPDGTETSYATPTITNPSTGTYELIVTGDQSGQWTYRGLGVTGTTSAVCEGMFSVLLSAF